MIKPGTLIMSFGAFVLVIASVTFLLTNVALNNPGSIDVEAMKNFNSTFNKENQYVDSSASIEGQVKEVTGDEGAFGFLNSIINQGWNIMKQFFSTFSFITQALNGLSAALNVPKFIIDIGVATITFIFVFGILSVVLNWDL